MTGRCDWTIRLRVIQLIDGSAGADNFSLNHLMEIDIINSGVIKWNIVYEVIAKWLAFNLWLIFFLFIECNLNESGTIRYFLKLRSLRRRVEKEYVFRNYSIN